MSRFYVPPVTVRCEECSNFIDTDHDPFCYVTPNRMIYDYTYKTSIPLCALCRSIQGYDIRTDYTETGSSVRVPQPLLARIAMAGQQPRPETIPKLEPPSISHDDAAATTATPVPADSGPMNFTAE